MLPEEGRTLSQAVTAWLDYVVDSHPGSTTASTRGVIGRGILQCLDGRQQVRDLTPGDLDDVVVWFIRGADEKEAASRKAQKLRARSGRRTKASIASVVSSLRDFAEYCARRRWVDGDIGVYKPQARSYKKYLDDVKRAPFVTFTEDEWPDLLARAERVHMRCRMAVALGLYAGRRASEIVRIQWKDIHWVRKEIIFFKKKDGEPVVFPLHASLEAEIKHWRRWAESNYGPVQDDWYLVPARKDGAGINGVGSLWRYQQYPHLYPVDMLRPSTVEKISKDVRALLGPLGYAAHSGTGTHTWRRSAAIAVDARYGLEMAQEFLTHDSIANTKIYTQGLRSNKELRKSLMRSGLGAVTTESEPPQPDNVVTFRRRTG